MVHAGAGIGGDEAAGRGFAAFGDVERQADGAVGADHGAAADQAVGIGQFARAAPARGRTRARQNSTKPSMRPRGSAWAMWSTVGEAVACPSGVGDRSKSSSLDGAAGRVGLDEVDQRAVGRADRGDGAFAGADRVPASRGQSSASARASARCGVVDAQRDGADRGAVQLEVFGGGAVLLGVEHEVDAALAVEVDRLGAVLAGVSGSRDGRGGRRVRRRRASSTANSMNSTPSKTGGGGQVGRPPASASARISERRPSRAVRRAGAARKSSLKISSEIGPA